MSHCPSPIAELLVFSEFFSYTIYITNVLKTIHSSCVVSVSMAV